ncbi:MAG: SAM-dependent methyltransferase [Myxococcota bacterium]|jgi:SAM-dependent methyltransferase
MTAESTWRVSDEPTPLETLDAALYARLQVPAIQPGDVPDTTFYSALCRDGTHVLEMGCGAGRIAQAVLESSPHCRLTGVDLHRGLLARARDRMTADQRPRATWVEDDLTTCDLGAVFDRVIMPFTTFFAFPGLPAKRAALALARRHTAPGGVFALDCYAIDDGADLEPQTPHDTGWDWLNPLPATADSGEAQVEERNMVLGPPGVIEVQYRFHRSEAPDAPHVQSVRHHFVSAATTVRLLIEAGFDHAEVYGGFDGRPYDEESVVMVVIAEP